MTIEIIVFIAAILFGILLYWRESNGNGWYRFVNKIVNSKSLQMKASSKKGFIYNQTFVLRLVYITTLFLLFALVLQFLTPFKIFGSYNGVSSFASSVVGTLLGTYLAGFIIKSGTIIEEQTESLSDTVTETLEKGKAFIEDLSPDLESEEEELPKSSKKQTPKASKKSARERLKDKGLM